jgi:TRAP-type transport system periplasmic protein
MFGTLGGLGVAPAWRAAAAETYTLRLSMAQPATNILGLAGLRFAAAVARRSNGQLKIEVYPSGQLSKEQESIDGLTLGSIDFTIVSVSFLERLFPQFQVFALPFLFKDAATAFRVVDGPVGDGFFAQLESKGIVGLCWGTSGTKEMATASKPVVVPADMRNLRIRIPNSTVYAATYQTLGAIPVVTDEAEVFTAVSQHTVEGMDIALDAFTTNKYYTVVKHVAMTNHVYTVNPLLGSKSKIEALPPVLQKIVKEEGRAIVPFWRSLQARKILEDIPILKNSGVVFTEPQYAVFRKALEPVYALIQSKVGGDVIERISRAANTAAGL